MPTYEPQRRFLRDFGRLTQGQRVAFFAAVRLLVAGLRDERFAPQLRIKRVRDSPGVWELTWAPHGRATFHYGEAVNPGEPHIVWRRIGSHSIFSEP